MTAAHFFAPSVEGDAIVLAGDDAHHARRVLRVRVGERITVSDGRGTVVEADVESLGDAHEPLVARVTARRSVAPPVPRLTVLPAVPKAGKLELVVQKLTELGVDEVRPWFAARTVVRWDERKARTNTERLRAVAYEAAKQSRRAWLPEIHLPGAPEPLPVPTYVLHEEAHVRLLDLLPAEPPARVALVVGPEGGLDTAEVDRLVGLGAQLAGLGPQILRAETAAIVAPALLLGRYRRIG